MLPEHDYVKLIRDMSNGKVAFTPIHVSDYVIMKTYGNKILKLHLPIVAYLIQL